MKVVTLTESAIVADSSTLRSNTVALHEVSIDVA